ncbi:hypothetical protein [Pararhodospirillum oryzae]|uniref:Uncharacterized protein n=1 Tax=Pararhodospirillum oryzae TaxID=478448 RepID=A0A512H966_9PROT|nr:hypothetical protein [Pararhodospirillum oryzae]GEO81940.1 hypothetical protein ROR02_20710 [Pararhodospirillum oryzae]
MLAEWILALTTPAPPATRRLGLVHDTVALWARSRRQARAWAPHREQAQAAVLRVADQAPGEGLAVVLGAGWLLEVPLEALAARFQQVVLVDAVIPWPTRLAIRRAGPGVRVLETDLTGILGPLAASPATEPVVPDPALFPPIARAADLVVSANVLSQLAVAPRRWMERAGQDGAAQDRVARALIDAHLAALAQCSGAVCLITDFEREERATDGAGAASRVDLLFGARPGVEGTRWWWDLAPPGEEGRHLRVRHRVMGGRFLAEGGGRFLPEGPSDAALACAPVP